MANSEIRAMTGFLKFCRSIEDMKYPKVRSDDRIVAQDILDEYVVYDLGRNKAHTLNPTAALVWRWCDGRTAPDEMVERLCDEYDLPVDEAEPMLWLTIDRLEKAKIMEEKGDRHVSQAGEMSAITYRGLEK